MSQCFLYNNCNHIDCDKATCLRKYKVGKLYDLAQLAPKNRVKLALITDNDGDPSRGIPSTDLAEFTRLSNIEKNIMEFVSGANNNLYIHSAICGNGKTSWSIRLLQAYIGKIWAKSELVPRALFISVPRLLEALKNNINTYDEYANYIIEHVSSVDLVIWDDIAAKSGSEYEINKLLSFIDARIAMGKANIFTSNLNKTQMYNALGARLASRICNGSIDIELNGSDKRCIVNM